jgi:hypothetical protein
MDSPHQKFFISDGGKRKLSLTKSELLAGIDSGKYSDATLAWTKGSSGWLPLSAPSWEKHGIVIEPQPPELPPSISDFQGEPTQSDTAPKQPAKFGSRKVPRNDKALGSRTYKILEHPTFGKKAVSIQAWSWLGFFFFGWYFLFLGRFKLFFKQVGIVAIGFAPFLLLESCSPSEPPEIEYGGILHNAKTRSSDEYDETLARRYHQINDKHWDDRMAHNYIVYGYLILLSISLPVILWVQGGLRGGKARFENLLAKGYTTIDEVRANNSSHALSVHEN